jgi:hypothetical protein
MFKSTHAVQGMYSFKYEKLKYIYLIIDGSKLRWYVFDILLFYRFIIRI